LNDFMDTKKKKILITAIILSVSIAAVAGGFLYFSRHEAPQDSFPPIIKEMVVLNDDIKKTMIKLYKAMEKLDSLGMVQSRMTDIETGIETIGILRDLAEENRKTIDRLVYFIDEHAEFIRRKNLSWVFAVNEFYRDPLFISHHESQADYFAAFGALLKYTGKNFSNIMEIKSKSHMANYDAYYQRYRKAADNYNRSNKKRIEFQKAFVETHTEVGFFLPGTHQPAGFRFWDKFSF